MTNLEQETKRYALECSAIIAEIEREVSEYYQFLPPYLLSELRTKVGHGRGKPKDPYNYFFIFSDYRLEVELVVNLNYVFSPGTDNSYELKGRLPRNEREIEKFLYRVGSWCGHAALQTRSWLVSIQNDIRQILREIENPEIIALRRELKEKDERIADREKRFNALDRILGEVILELERTKSRFKSPKIAEIRQRLEEARRLYIYAI